MRFSKSASRGFTKTGWVCESTKPGRTTCSQQSISIIFFLFFLIQGSERASLVLPTETIFPPATRTAPSLMMPSSLSSDPRRGPGLPDGERRVRNWRILTSSKAAACDLAFWTVTGLNSLSAGRSNLPHSQIRLPETQAFCIFRQSHDRYCLIGKGGETRVDLCACETAQALWHR